MPTKLSLPRDKIKVLLLEGVSSSAAELFRNAGYSNIETLSLAPSTKELDNLIANAHIVGIRSRTQLDAEILSKAKKLFAVGCFCIGTNQVNLVECASKGIPVFNAPFSNTRSVAELVMGEIVMLLRRVILKSNAAHAGDWDKSAKNSYEVRGKTLGIVGYGNIGTQLSVLAEAFGMKVIYFDIIDKLSHGNTQSVASLSQLIEESDILSLHVPETESTFHMIGAKEIRRMKKGAYLINNSRGNVVNIDALAQALRSGHLLGAAVDVFPVEPKANGDRFQSSLQGLENVILTPHIGGSTEEAHLRIGGEVAKKLLDYSELGTTLGAVNFPEVFLSSQKESTRYMHVHQNIPGVLRKVVEIFSEKRLNIVGQHLQTSGETGYLVIDTECGNHDSSAILQELKKINGTIRARLLYGKASK